MDEAELMHKKTRHCCQAFVPGAEALENHLPPQKMNYPLPLARF
jgi:hypothetical protein